MASDILYLEDMKKLYPMDDFYYIREKKSGKYFNFYKKTFVDDVLNATQVSPGTVRTLKKGPEITISNLGKRMVGGEIEAVPIKKLNAQ